MRAPVTIDGRSLSIADVVAVARDGATVAIAARALRDVARSREVVEAALARGATIYGVTTGFGKLAHVRIPAERSVGASGDLAPLAHLALALVGEGDDGAALQAAGLEPIVLEAKEGLAFVNGTQAQAGLAALLVHDAWVLWRTAHAAAAMSLEAVRG